MRLPKLIAVSTLLCTVIIAGTIDLNALFDYSNQSIPSYIAKDNTPANNPITDEAATLGRVLFYDKNLSLNNTVSCASCHKQEFAFSDTARLSVGFDGGLTTRHAMRLVNSRFANEGHFFWDERATTLELQTLEPIQNAVEMGFSSENGQPDLDSMINKLSVIDYYKTLFKLAFGDTVVTENRIQRAIAQFVRSIQSFDSKFDVGFAQTNNLNANFPNYTAQENEGKRLFLAPPPIGAGCQGCHAAPEFDIKPNSGNNGVIAVAADSTQIDLTNTKAPSLRDLINPSGAPNGPMMHNGNFATVMDVINHYNLILPDQANTNLDPVLAGPNGQGQMLNLTETEKQALAAFLATLTGSDVYTNERWSNPFDSAGNLTVVPLETDGIENNGTVEMSIFPNPASGIVTVKCVKVLTEINVYSINGSLVKTLRPNTTLARVSIEDLPSGILFIETKTQNGEMSVCKIIKI